MKGIIAIIVFFFICNNSFALNKYVDSTGGTIGGNGNSPGTAYKSLSQVNAIIASLNAGDSILLKRGEVWHNQLYVKTGIHVGTYGSGAKPIISAMVSVTGWTNIGTNLWQSAINGGTNTYMSMVTIDDAAIAMGRWPNANAANGGYATYDSMNSLTQIRSVTAMPFDFTGMTLCMRKITDILARENITSVSGTTINHENLTGTNYKGFDGYGYFIENSPSTSILDVQKEWYFNPSTRRLIMYSVGAPTGVKISTIDTLVLIGGNDNVTFDDIAFDGANVVAISIGSNVSNSTGTVVNRCDFTNMGRDGIYGTNNTNTVVDSCYFNHMMNNGVSFINQGGNTINPIITHNFIKNIGIAGMNFLDYANGFKASFEGITNGTSAVAGQLGMTAKFNEIDTVGHVGIRFYQNNTFIDSNLVNYHNYITGDAGAINCFDNTFGAIIETNRTIIGNICINGIGAGLGAGGFPNVNGIYIDDKSDGIIIRRNFVANLGWITGGFNGSCIYLHNVTNIDVLNNVGYNGGYAQFTLAHDGNAVGMPLRNINAQNNLFFSKLNTAKFMVVRTRINDVGQIFNPLNNNRYWRPTLITGATFQAVTNYQVAGQVVSDYTLPTWQTTFAGATNGPYDAASTQGGSNTGATDFVYNFTNHDSTLNFAGLSYLVPQYNSPYQQVYNNSMVLAPYTGYIRIANGVAPPINKFPVANAGADIILTLPVNSTNINGTGSDSDGVIQSYSWTQISGPNSATITPASSLSTGTTNVSNLIEGIYFFQLTVMDNNGATGTDIVRVTVNAAIPNTPPTANAGVDKTITLPTNTTSVTGTGTNGSGTSRTYLWTQASGPATATIVSPTAATTNINSLNSVGTYTFRLKVTNTPIGDSAIDFMQIFVLAQPFNQPPVVNAGTDSTITLPVNSVHLIGTATDPDGTIVSTTWDKFSGPATYTITSPSSLSTTVTNMVQGVYEFRLIGVDNQGKSDTDFVIITVNPAIPPPNVPPTVSYISLDQVITLPTSSVIDTVRGVDSDGTIAAWKWVQISGPTTVSFSNPTDSVTTVSGMTVAGTYIMQGRVYDDDGDSAFKNTKITVNPLPNTLPNAVAGNDTTITLPANTAHVNGLASNDPSGSITAYQWRQLSGPNTATIVSANTAETDINNLIEGAYIFQLWVQGNGGATDTAVDAMQVTVNAAPVLNPPVANVGPAQTITLPTNSVTLTGSGTNGSGTITTHVWTLFSGPGGSTIATPNNYTTAVNNLVEGTYQFELTVTDTNDLIGTALVQITVRPEIQLQRVLLRGYRF